MDPLTEEEVGEIERYLTTLKRNLPAEVTNVSFDRKRGIVIHTHANGTTREVPANTILRLIVPFR